MARYELLKKNLARLRDVPDARRLYGDDAVDMVLKHEYGAIVEKAQGHQHLAAMEHEVLRTTHAHVSGYLAETWKLLKTTRPHCVGPPASGASALTGVLKVKCVTTSFTELPV